jgi:hypothetical protein
MEFRKLFKTSNLMNLRPMGAELSCGQTDRYAEANCRFSQFCERWKQADKAFFVAIGEKIKLNFFFGTN